MDDDDNRGNGRETENGDGVSFFFMFSTRPVAFHPLFFRKLHKWATGQVSARLMSPEIYLEGQLVPNRLIWALAFFKNHFFGPHEC